MAAAVVLIVVVASIHIEGASGGPVAHRRSRSSSRLSRLPRGTKSLYVDARCRGVYSRQLWSQLYHVCEDCDNVFREDGFQAECREGCFASDTFAFCLAVLEKDVKLYQMMATSLRGS